MKKKKLYRIQKYLHMIFDNKKNRIMYLFIPCLDITAIFLKFDLINNKVHHILKNANFSTHLCMPLFRWPQGGRRVPVL